MGDFTMKKNALLFLMILFLQPGFSQNFDRLRNAMVHDQIMTRGIKHKPTLDAMRKVKRHLFVPDKNRIHAYDDNPLSIGYGQTISQPFIVAYMTSLIDPKPGDRVLEIGTGSGYQAAVLASMQFRSNTFSRWKLLPKCGNVCQTTA